MKSNINNTAKHLIICFSLIYSFTLFSENSTDDPLQHNTMKNNLSESIEYQTSLLCNQLPLSGTTNTNYITNPPSNRTNGFRNHFTRDDLADFRIKQMEEISFGEYLIRYDAREHFNYTTADGNHPLDWCDDSVELLSFTNFCYHDFRLQAFFRNIYFNRINATELAFRLIVWNCEEGVDWAYGWHNELPFLFPFRGAGLNARPEDVIEQCKKEINYIREATFHIQKFASEKTEYVNEIQKLKAQRSIYLDNINQYDKILSEEGEIIGNLCSLQQSIIDINKKRDSIQTQLNSFISRHDVSNMDADHWINLIKSDLSENNSLAGESLKQFIIELEKALLSNSEKTQISLSQLQNFISNNVQNNQNPFLPDTISSMILDSNNRINSTQTQKNKTQKKVKELTLQINRKTNGLESLSRNLVRILYGGNVTVSGPKTIRLYKILTEIPAFSLRFHITHSYSKNGPWGRL